MSAITLTFSSNTGVNLPDYSKIDKKMIEHICLIAKLSLSDEEKTRYSKELSDVLEAFKVINSIDTSEKPSFHPIEIKDRLREDEVKPTKWDSLSNARAKDGRYFKGPKII